MLSERVRLCYCRNMELTCWRWICQPTWSRVLWSAPTSTKPAWSVYRPCLPKLHHNLKKENTYFMTVKTVSDLSTRSVLVSGGFMGREDKPCSRPTFLGTLDFYTPPWERWKISNLELCLLSVSNKCTFEALIHRDKERGGERWWKSDGQNLICLNFPPEKMLVKSLLRQ